MASMVLTDIQRLREKLIHLNHQAEHWDHHRTREAYHLLGFVDERFNCRSDSFLDYAHELEEDLKRIERLATKTSDIELLTLYCERFSGKFAMLQRKFEAMAKPKPAIATKVVNWQKQLKKAMDSSELPELHEKLAQQRHFETQLKNQIELKLHQHRHSNKRTEIDKLERDILALKHRLGSCERATWQVEQRITQLESRFKE
jgi:primosomal protein N''